MKKEVKPALKQEVKKEVDKELAKEVEQKLESEVGSEIKKDISAGLHRRFDLIDKFRGLESHNKFLFSLLVGLGLVGFWRGTTIVMDHLIFPGQPLISGFFTLFFGLTILAASGALLRVLH